MVLLICTDMRPTLNDTVYESGRRLLSETTQDEFVTCACMVLLICTDKGATLNDTVYKLERGPTSWYPRAWFLACFEERTTEKRSFELTFNSDRRLSTALQTARDAWCAEVCAKDTDQQM